MAAKKETYSEAMKRLEEIVSRIESNELDIDQLGEYLQEAQKLIKFCKNKLYKADAEIKKILEEDNGPLFCIRTQGMHRFHMPCAPPLI